MAPRDDATRLRDVVSYGRKDIALVHGRSREDLDQDELLQLALERLLEVVGEAAAHVSPPLRQASPHVPWPAMIAMRNRLVHAYVDVSRDIVWNTVTLALPDVLRDVEAILARLGGTAEA